MSTLPVTTHHLIPSYWLKCPKIGQIITKTPFILAKAPIDITPPTTTHYDITLLTADPYYQFTLLQLVEYFKTNTSKIPPLGMIINITATPDLPLYDTTTLTTHAIKYVTIPIDPHTPLYDTKQCINITRLFNSIVNKFIDTNTDKSFTARTIVVHDTYGYNLPGYCITSYLVDECNYSLSTALSDVAVSRSPGVYDKHALISLQMRFGVTGEKVSIPKPPVFDKSVAAAKPVSAAPVSKPQSSNDIAHDAPNGNSTSTATATAVTKPAQKRGFVKAAALATAIASTASTAAEPSADTNKRTKSDDNGNAATVSDDVSQQHPFLHRCNASQSSLITSAIQKLAPTSFTHATYTPVDTSALTDMKQHKHDYTVSWLPQGHQCILSLVDGSAYLCVSRTQIYTIASFTAHASHNNTVALGELVIDTDTKTQIKSHRLLLTDLLSMHGDTSITTQPLDIRLTEAQRVLIDEPTKLNSNAVKACPLKLRVKKMFPSSSIGKAIAIIKSLPHPAIGITLQYNRPVQGEQISRYHWLLNDKNISQTELINTLVTT